MFGITTAREFREKAARDNAALMADVANADLAINAILSAYHLHEWVWRLEFKPNRPVSLRGEALRTKSEWVQWLDKNCPHFGLLQELANGSKHCVPVKAGRRIAGYGAGPYGVGPFGKPYLLIDRGNEKSTDERWLVGHRVLKDVTDFWAELGTEVGF